MTTTIKLPCDGQGGTHKINKVSATIEFKSKGSCNLTNFNFVDGSGNSYTPPGFSNRQPSSGGGSTISYAYDGSAIPSTGYNFAYATDTPTAGNGSGTIKNT